MKFMPRSRATRTLARASLRSTGRNSCPSEEAPNDRTGRVRPVRPRGRRSTCGISTGRCRHRMEREVAPGAPSGRCRRGLAAGPLPFRVEVQLADGLHRQVEMARVVQQRLEAMMEVEPPRRFIDGPDLDGVQAEIIRQA